MSLSKVYKDTASFVPEQILPRQGLPPEPVWQEMVTAHPSRSGDSGTFTPDKTDRSRRISDITPDKQSLPSEELADKENSLSADIPPEAEEEGGQTPIPAIDLQLIHTKAFSEGVLEGRRQADEDFGTSADTLRAACEQLTNLHETILLNNISEMHAMVMKIAEKIIRHSIKEQSETIVATLKDAIHLAVKSEEFQIRVNPKDLEALKSKKKEIIDEISGLENIVLMADSTVDRGGCLLESVNCSIDATIGSQLQVIQETLQSDNIDATFFPGEP